MRRRARSASLWPTPDSKREHRYARHQIIMSFPPKVTDWGDRAALWGPWHSGALEVREEPFRQVLTLDEHVAELLGLCASYFELQSREIVVQKIP
jgi:hypothetical protein